MKCLMRWQTVGVSLALVFLGAHDVGAQTRFNVMVGTTSPASSVYAYYAAMAKIASDRNSPIRLTIVETGGVEENIARMGKGEFDLGIGLQPAIGDAYNGESKNWEGKPQKHLRVLNMFYVAPQAFLVRQDSGVKTVQDLNGKPWSPGHRGSASEATTLAILDALEAKPKLFRAALTDIIRAIKNNEITGFSKGLPGFYPDAAMLDIQASHPVLMVGFNESEQATLRKKLPALPLIEIPAKLASRDSNIMSFAFLVGTIANASVPDEVAYEFNRLAFEQRDELAKSFKAVGEPENDMLKLTMAHAGIPLHPGAVKYFREKGYNVPDRLLPKN